MSVLSRDQRSAERQQTFYTAFAYVRKGDQWSRHAVKVFDQSYNGVRLRSMQNLGGEELYVQLDMTSPVVALCHAKRVHPVARNCWEFGIELGGLAEIHTVIPQEVIERFCDAGTAQHVSAVIEVPNAPPSPSPVDELSNLLKDQLGLPESAPEPVAEATEPTPVTEQPRAVEQPQQATEPTMAAEPAAAEPVEKEEQTGLQDATITADDAPETATASEEPRCEPVEVPEPVVEEQPTTVDEALDLLIQTVEQEPISSSTIVEEPEAETVVEEPASEEEVAPAIEEAAEDSLPEVLPTPEEVPVAEATPVVETPIESEEPETAPTNTAESSRSEPLPVPPIAAAVTESKPVATPAPSLQVPTIQRATFVQTVAVGFAGLSELAIAALKVPVQAFKKQFINRKTDEEQRLEWLQICAGTVNPPKKK